MLDRAANLATLIFGSTKVNPFCHTLSFSVEPQAAVKNLLKEHVSK